MTRYVIFPILWVGALSVAAAHVMVGALFVAMSEISDKLTAVAAAHVMVGALFGLLPVGVGLAVVDVAAAAGVTWWGVRLVRKEG